MIIRKNVTKNDSVIIGFWFSNPTNRLENGKKSMVYRIPISDMKSSAHLKSELEKFLKNYVKMN
jgi:hypothetical protein